MFYSRKKCSKPISRSQVRVVDKKVKYKGWNDDLMVMSGDMMSTDKLKDDGKWAIWLYTESEYPWVAEELKY